MACLTTGNEPAMNSSVLRRIKFQYARTERATRIVFPNNARVRIRLCLRLYSSRVRGDVIFSGIQPTGVPHLGNYLGALQQWTRMQEEAAPSTKLIYSIVDLHAITMAQDADQLRVWKRETLATLLASGLDPERSTIFYQSAVRISGLSSLDCYR